MSDILFVETPKDIWVGLSPLMVSKGKCLFLMLHMRVQLGWRLNIGARMLIVQNSEP